MISCEDMRNSLILLCLPSLLNTDANNATQCAQAYSALSCDTICDPSFRLFPDQCANIVPLSNGPSQISCR